MSFVLVKNLNGTSNNTPPQGYNSWLHYWKVMHSLSTNLIPMCSCRGCNQKASVGAHVKKATINDNNWYIIPLCYNHNNQPSTELFAVEREALVPANISNL